ncbi:transposase, Ptta/En/Spm, transposase, Tnp1/En/Spm-like protein [Tanacetum coccineum]
METQAIDDQAHLANYDNDNEIENDDLGYHSEEYFYTNGNVVKRGITRLYKFRMEYGKPGGVKLSVTFDALNRISGKHRALFSSFLGDMVREHIGLKILAWNKVGSEARDKLWDEITRYFDVDLTSRKLVMNRLGQLLRNFRTKLRRTYILPNQDTPSKLNEVPAKYTAILKAEEWVNFVKYTATQAYKVKSAVGKMARSKCLYPHTMGRGGYAHVKEQMIEIFFEPDEEPSRGTLWLKGRVNKDRDYPYDEIRSVGDKLKETEDKIKERTLKVDQGIDAITVVLGKEKGGYARGVGSGVRYKRYFDLPRSKQAADERILVSWLKNSLIYSSADEEGDENQLTCWDFVIRNDASISEENAHYKRERENCLKSVGEPKEKTESHPQKGFSKSRFQSKKMCRDVKSMNRIEVEQSATRSYEDDGIHDKLDPKLALLFEAKYV